MNCRRGIFISSGSRDSRKGGSRASASQTGWRYEAWRRCRRQPCGGSVGRVGSKTVASARDRGDDRGHFARARRRRPDVPWTVVSAPRAPRTSGELGVADVAPCRHRRARPAPGVRPRGTPTAATSILSQSTSSVVARRRSCGGGVAGGRARGTGRARTRRRRARAQVCATPARALGAEVIAAGDEAERLSANDAAARATGVAAQLDDARRVARRWPRSRGDRARGRGRRR